MEIRASVAMAVCNGEKYIEQQIDTIVDMMASNDGMYKVFSRISKLR